MEPVDNVSHLSEAVKWIYRAQDASPDKGVSHSYAIAKGWAPSYPETTGYIIPSLLNWSRVADDSEAQKRAFEMADWEIEIQLNSGAVMSSVVGLPKMRPVVFNTGQVIFGWISAYRETGHQKYLNAALKAADWLVDNLDQNNVWSSHGNAGTKGIHTYNVRSAWAMLLLSEVASNSQYADRMNPLLEWILLQEVDRGWFRHNCLNNNKAPLLHTIAYTARGLLESGLILGENIFIDASMRTANELLNHVAHDGSMPGRFDQHWKGTVRWSCLTGMAQMSLVWAKLFRVTQNTQYAIAAKKVNDFLKRMQDIKSENPGIRGGIKGSYPINGQYGRYRILNWATKFFIDALLLEEYPDLPEYSFYHDG